MLKILSDNLPFPSEIRNKIYRHLLPPLCLKSLIAHYREVFAIFRVSKSIRGEPVSLYYYEAHWKFEDPKSAIQFLESLSPALFVKIRALVLEQYPPAGPLEKRLSDLLRRCCNLETLVICVNRDFLFCLPRNDGIYHWGARTWKQTLGLLRLRGLQELQIVIYECCGIVHRQMEPRCVWQWGQWHRTRWLNIRSFPSCHPLTWWPEATISKTLPPMMESPLPGSIERQERRAA